MAVDPAASSGAPPGVQFRAAPPDKPKAPKSADGGRYFAVVVVGLGIIALLSILELSFGKPASTSTAAAAAGILALVGALAVGIERTLEAVWTLVDQLAKNPSLPFSSDAALLANFANQLDAVVKTPLEQTRDFLTTVDQAALQALRDKPTVQQQIDVLLQSVNQVLAGQQDPNAWQALGGMRAGIVDLSGAFQDKQTQAALQTAVSGLDALSGWVSSLVANPGRKITSLLAGSAMGIALSWLLGLDVVHAALGVPASSTALNAGPPSTWAWGMVVTGLVVGLGSNPTHELINAIQAYKDSKK